MKNFLFYLGHAMLITGIVCFKMTDVGPVSWIFLMVALASYIAGVFGRANSFEEDYSFGDVIDTERMSPEDRLKITGQIIWRNAYSDFMVHWDVDKKNFIHRANPDYEKISRHSHTLNDYHEAKKSASLIQQTGMLYFLPDTDCFPKDKSLLS